MAEKQYTRQAQEALNMARKIAAELKHPYVWSRITHKVISLNNIIKKTDHKSINKLTYGQFCCILVL